MAFLNGFAGNFSNTGTSGNSRTFAGNAGYETYSLGNVGTTAGNAGYETYSLGNVGVQPPVSDLQRFLNQMLRSLNGLFNNWQGVNSPLSQIAQLPVRDDIRESIHRQMAVSGNRATPPTQQEINKFERQFEFIPGRQRYPEGFGWTKVEQGVLYNSQGVPIGKVRPEFAQNFSGQPQPPVYQPPVYQTPVYQYPSYPPVAPPPLPVATGVGEYR